MGFWSGLTIGLIAGAFAGLVFVAILTAGRERDVEEEQLRQYQAGYRAGLKRKAMLKEGGK